MKKMASIADIDAFIFDFDGVLTDNLVHVDQEGRESVACNRADGLAFDVLRKLNIPLFIISTETNPVVLARAKKLQIPAIHCVFDKEFSLKKLAKENSFDLAKVFYVGNDLNDYYAIRCCGYSACPADSHGLIKNVSRFVLTTLGGQGVVREIVENILNIDIVEILYSKSEN